MTQHEIAVRFIDSCLVVITTCFGYALLCVAAKVARKNSKEEKVEYTKGFSLAANLLSYATFIGLPCGILWMIWSAK